MSRYLEGPNAGDLLVDTTGEDGYHALLPLRDVLARAARVKCDVLFEPPCGLAEAAAHIITDEERVRYESRKEKYGIVLTRSAKGWSYAKPAQTATLQI